MCGPTRPIPASWPVGDPYLPQAEAGLPALTYKQVFTDAAAPDADRAGARQQPRPDDRGAPNIAAAREQYHIQRAQPAADAQRQRRRDASPATRQGRQRAISGGLSTSRASSSTCSAALRSLTHVQLKRYLATEAGARATRLTLVADIANAWLDHAADSSLLIVSPQQTAESAQKSVRLTRLRLEGGIAPRTDLGQAEQILASAQADLARQRTAVAQDVNALQLLVGAPIAPALLAGRSTRRSARSRRFPPASIPTCCCAGPTFSRPSIELRAANANIGAARAALFPRITLTGLLGFASSALPKPVHRRRLRLERGGGCDLHDLPGRRRPRERPAHPSRSAMPPRDVPGHDPVRVPRGRRRAGPPRHDQRRDRRAAAAAGRHRRRLSADRGSLQRRNRPLPDRARRAAFLLCRPADAGEHQAHRGAEHHRDCIRRSAAMRCSGTRSASAARRYRQANAVLRRSAARTIRQARPAARSSRANARPYNRRRYAAAPRRDASSAACSAIARSFGGSSGAMLRQHQARLRFSPSRWAIFPSLRSLTNAGVNRRRRLRDLRRRGRNCSNQPETASGWVRAMHKASISAGDRNSSPPGSHAWQSRSAPNQCSARSRISCGSGWIECVSPFEREDQRESGVEMRADADRIGQDRQIVAAAARRRRARAAPAPPPSARAAASLRGGDRAAMPSRKAARTRG